MAERMVTLERNTNETQIELTLDLDGTGRYEIDTGCGFLNHMLELFARHGRFDLVLTCHGDVQVDYHHTTEDVAGAGLCPGTGRDARHLPLRQLLPAHGRGTGAVRGGSFRALHPELGHPLPDRKGGRF